MITLTKNNYLRQSGTGNTFNIAIDPLPTKFDNHFIESCRAAEEIYSNKQGKLHILYSGGLDSEHTLAVFLHLGLDVTPVIIQLNTGYNKHDIDYAFQYCESKKLKPVVIDIDFDNFVRSGQMLSIAKDIKSEVYHRSATAYAAGLLDGTVLLGDGEPHIKLNIEDKKWYYNIFQHDLAVANYFSLNGIYGTTHFGCWTAEMTVSFLLDERIQNLAKNKFIGRLGSQSSKHYVYNRHSNFNLIVRKKLTGYEIIENSKIFNDDSFKELKEFGKTCNGTYYKNYFDMMKENGLPICL
jgi:hypothetical protein